MGDVVSPDDPEKTKTTAFPKTPKQCHPAPDADALRSTVMSCTSLPRPEAESTLSVRRLWLAVPNNSTALVRHPQQTPSFASPPRSSLQPPTRPHAKIPAELPVRACPKFGDPLSDAVPIPRVLERHHHENGRSSLPQIESICRSDHPQKSPLSNRLPAELSPESNRSSNGVPPGRITKSEIFSDVFEKFSCVFEFNMRTIHAEWICTRVRMARAIVDNFIRCSDNTVPSMLVENSFHLDFRVNVD